MQSKLILSLWILGGLLYAGSTVFLANTLLGGPSTGKKEPIKLAVAAGTECQTDSIAAAKADDTKTAALDTAQSAAPKQPAPVAAKPEAPAEPAGGEDAAAIEEPNQDWQPSDGDPDAYPQAEMPGDGQEEGAWYEDQAGAQPDAPMEAEEWAHVIAGTANMRSEPDLRSPLIYALPSGWQVRVISRQPGWVQVQDANSGASGWVDASAIAPGAGPNAHPGYGGYPPRRGDPYRRYADEGYPYPPPWQQRRRERRDDFGAFLGRVFGGF